MLQTLLEFLIFYKMKITLIQPSIGKHEKETYPRSWSMYPLNLAVIAGLTPKENEISFYDDRFENIPYEDHTDLVAMPAETYTAKRTYSIADKFRKKGIPVVLGGMHATLVSEEAKQHADSVIVGDAEPVWTAMLEDFKNKSAKRFYHVNPTGKQLETVSIDRGIFRGRNYLPLSLIETGRGCYFDCDFCAVTAAHQRTYRTKPIEQIVKEIEQTQSRNIYFVDDNFVSDFKRTKELCDAITPLNVRWISQGSVNMADDPILLSSLERSGCFNMLIGFESLNPEALKAMGKSWASSKRGYSESMKRIRDHGITVYATFVFGYDTDNKDDFKRTLDFAIDQKFAITAFNHLVPFPGTPLYRRLEGEGRLLYDNWWLRDKGKFGEVVFQPKNMSPEELADNCFKCRESFYEYGSIAKRLLDFKANSRNLTSAGYLTWVNLFSKHEAKKRQGWQIGGIY